MLSRILITDIRKVKQLKQGDASVEANVLEKCGILQAAQGKYEEAIQSHKASLISYQRLSGANNINVANALYNIGVCMNSSGSNKGSSKLLKKSLRTIQDVMGAESLECVDVLHQLAISLEDDPSQAKRNLMEAIHLLRKHSQDDTLKAAELNALIGELVSFYYLQL